MAFSTLNSFYSGISKALAKKPSPIFFPSNKLGTSTMSGQTYTIYSFISTASTYTQSYTFTTLICIF